MSGDVCVITHREGQLLAFPESAGPCGCGRHTPVGSVRLSPFLLDCQLRGGTGPALILQQQARRPGVSGPVNPDARCRAPRFSLRHGRHLFSTPWDRRPLTRPHIPLFSTGRGAFRRRYGENLPGAISGRLDNCSLVARGLLVASWDFAGLLYGARGAITEACSATSCVLKAGKIP